MRDNPGKKSVAAIGLVLLLIGLPQVASAGLGTVGSVSFGPLESGAASIPTLGGWMLILLSLFLAFVGFSAIRRQGHHGGLAAIPAVGILVGAVAAGGGGIGLVTDVGALSPGGTITDPEGGTFDIFDTSNTYNNASGASMVVKDVEITGLCLTPFDTAGMPCEEGTAIPDGESCEIDCLGALE